MRLHLLTSRKPIAGSVAPEDTLVLMEESMDKQARQDMVEAVLAENPPASGANFLSIADIGYEGLVVLTTQCTRIVSW